jgi:hypothetical protein
MILLPCDNKLCLLELNGACTHHMCLRKEFIDYLEEEDN